MAFEQVVYDPVQSDTQDSRRMCTRRRVLIPLCVAALLASVGLYTLKTRQASRQGASVKVENGFLGLFSDGTNSCQTVTTQPGFDLTSYISAPWYIQQQMAIQYLPVENNICVEARYSYKKGFWPGQTIAVQNFARKPDGSQRDTAGFLCAGPGKDTTDPAKLQVGPCFLPQLEGVFSGPYWIIAYNEAEGYALVSGGQPYIQMANGCATGTGINNSGLWILTRQQLRNEVLVQKVRQIALQQGFDISVLNDVDNTNCQGTPAPGGCTGLSCGGSVSSA